jgi:hypothetical protein
VRGSNASALLSDAAVKVEQGTVDQIATPFCLLFGQQHQHFLLTATPATRGGQVRLAVPGGSCDRGFSFTWPIWREPTSLPAIRAMLRVDGVHFTTALAHSLVE